MNKEFERLRRQTIDNCLQIIELLENNDLKEATNLMAQVDDWVDSAVKYSMGLADVGERNVYQIRNRVTNNTAQSDDDDVNSTSHNGSLD